MTLKVRDLTIMLNGIFKIKDYEQIDKSVNGLQVGDLNKEVKKLAFSVDSSFETLKEASDFDFLITHHGLFWSKGEKITSSMYSKVKLLVENDLALYACHLPLDSHPIYSNSKCLSDFIGFRNPLPFACYKGALLGIISVSDFNFQEIIKKIKTENKHILFSKEFKKNVNKVAIVSGNGYSFFEEALEYDVDLFITGDTSHQIYSLAEEANVNLIFAGHYFTETFGLKALMEDLKKQENLETKFIFKDTNL